MAKMVMGWKTKGMNKDLSVSAFNPEFSFDNRNLRLSTNEKNTQLSWVNEKGTLLIDLVITTNQWDISNEAGHEVNANVVHTIQGIPIGTAVINDKLVLFTVDPNDDRPDRIYALSYANESKNTMHGKLLYSGHLNFQLDHPLETLVSFETDFIQKVYWTDGINQLRMINIEADNGKLKVWNSTLDGTIDTFFDFVPEIELNESFNVTQNFTSDGIFPAGVIQYCFTYLNKYGQQSNIVDISPLYYITFSDRALAPDNKTSCSFTLEFSNLDTNFEYIRIYSIQRTSYNDAPIVKNIIDLPIPVIPAKEYIVTPVYEDSYNDALTLPKQGDNRIVTITAENGSYDVVFAESSLTGYYNYNPFLIVGYDNDMDPHILVGGDNNNITLKYLIENYSDCLVFEKYYAYLDLSKNSRAYKYINGLAKAREYYKGAGVKVTEGNQSIYFDPNDAGTDGWKAVYNYKDSKWYFTNKVVSYDENPDNKTLERSITFVDNGAIGGVIDPYELLYAGGKDISALTMAHKDNTLFLGNITERNSLVNDIQEYYRELMELDEAISEESDKNIQITYNRGGDDKTFALDRVYGVYSHTNTLKQNLKKITSFKGGETYRFGFQLQKKTGEWLDPIFIGDKRNELYPLTVQSGALANSVELIYASCQLNIPCSFNMEMYKRIRPVMVYPNMSDRTVLCQGVLNPTVFNARDRVKKDLYAQSSWFFRPYVHDVNSATPVSTVSIDWSTAVSVEKKLKSSASAAEISGVGSDEWGVSDTNALTTYNLLRSVYVIVVHFTSTPDIYQTLSNGYLRYISSEYILQNGNWTNTTNSTNAQNFIGAIDLGENVYAFLSDYRWKTLGESYYSGNTQKEVVRFLGGLEIYSNSSDTSAFDFPTDAVMRVADGKLYSIGYTTNDTLVLDAVRFRFYSGDYYYSVIFSRQDSEGNYVAPNSNGSTLKFGHYESIYTQDDALAGTQGTFAFINDSKKIEIQGSRNDYVDAFTDNNDPKSNTQFFIDHSIVTLNSPDIDFDTNVQTYDTENLKLRIIGAVPITSNSSAFSIIISNAKLELERNASSSTYNYTKFGTGEKGECVIHNNGDSYAGKRLIADYLWNDAVVTEKTTNSNNEDDVKTDKDAADFLIFPWQRTGALTNDTRTVDNAASVLETKKESTLLFSRNTEYVAFNNAINYGNISTKIHLRENEQIINYRLKQQKGTSSEINYYPNIEKPLYNEEGYLPITNPQLSLYGLDDDDCKLNTPVIMKYKSGSHAIIGFNAPTATGDIPILPKYGTIGQYTNGSGSTFWGDTDMLFSQLDMNVNGVSLISSSYDFLWLGELYKDVDESVRFGGNSDAALQNNNWQIAGDAVNLGENVEIDGTLYKSVNLIWSYGDTFYQRYDCLKTYASTPTDENQLVEILSFMCESRYNIDGRYDSNRGQLKNYVMSPVNFNLCNDVYTQSDNFFQIKKVNVDTKDKLVYPNYVYYSKTKDSGADVDLWTNITLASVLELDGDKGSIKALERFNDQMFAFQDTGIAQILYNENVQISTEQGVPIEIANSGKVQGARYISNTIGCSNKWSIAESPLGIYFMDNSNKSIYLFNGQLSNISDAAGFNTWAKKMPSSDIEWNQLTFKNFKSHYDRINQEVLFTDDKESLAFSETMKAFTSFYDYAKAPYFCNLEDTGVWTTYDFHIEVGLTSVKHYETYLWKHHAGDYCNFFGKNYPYSTVLVGNPNPTEDKIFTNIEFRACVDGDMNNDKFILPFDSIEAWNEYQHGIADLDNRRGHSAMLHHLYNGNDASLKRKFRIWRCDIPRDNCEVNRKAEEEMGIYRFIRKPLNRMRNPWVYLKLLKNAPSNDNDRLERTEIHDIVMDYYI